MKVGLKTEEAEDRNCCEFCARDIHLEVDLEELVDQGQSAPPL